MDQEMITDITLDHLPDLSEASVSFQIPTNNASADLLLVDHTGGFDLLCDAIDNDASFAPVSLNRPRGRPLTLDELTPRVKPTLRPTPPSRSPTPTHAPPSSARSPALGRRSPDKRARTPSRAKSIRRQLESPLVSEERLHQLRGEIETLGQADEAPSHVQVHVAETVEGRAVERESPLRLASSERRLDPLPEEGEDRLAETTIIPVTAPGRKFKRNPRRTKPTVATGGISKRPAATHVSKKTKRRPSRDREAHQMPPSIARQITPPRSIVIDTEEGGLAPACMNNDTDLTFKNTQIARSGTGGMAERLVSYSQKVISSIGLFRPENSLAEASDDGTVGVVDAHVRPQLPATASLPSPPPGCTDGIRCARLPEISPHKQPTNAPQPSSAAHTGTLQDGMGHDEIPIRSYRKRVRTDEDLAQEYRRGKKGKTTGVNSDSEGRSSDEASCQATPRSAENASHKDRPVTQSETCDSTRDLNASKSTLPCARRKYKPKIDSTGRCKGPTLDAFPYLSSSRQVQRSLSKDKGKRDEGQPKTANVQAGSSLSRFSGSTCRRRVSQGRADRHRFGPVSAVDLPLIEKKQKATLSVATLTKPVGFTFRVEARLEARRAEERLSASEPGKRVLGEGDPDLKILRGSHPAEVGSHREGVVPSVPVVPFSFCTEQRAKEREKFDEMVRRKQEEMEREKEEERRWEAEEEERAIKELRRKAIPKANEIPEWYAEMPKRKGTANVMVIDGAK